METNSIPHFDKSVLLGIIYHILKNYNSAKIRGISIDNKKQLE